MTPVPTSAGLWQEFLSIRYNGEIHLISVSYFTI